MSSGLSISAGLRRGAEYVHGYRVVTVDAAPVHDAAQDRWLVLFTEGRCRRAMPMDEFVDTFVQRPEGIADEDC